MVSFILGQQHAVAIAMKRAATFRDLSIGLYVRIEDMKSVHGKPVTGGVFDLDKNACTLSSAYRDFRDFHFLRVSPFWPADAVSGLLVLFINSFFNLSATDLSIEALSRRVNH